MRLADFTATEQSALNIVQRSGAVTIRVLTAHLGPRTNYDYLFESRLLVERATVYGSVVGYSAAGYRWAEETFGQAAYLQGPSALADRAYQIDALTLLQARGYEAVRAVYKRGTKAGTYTDHIVRLVVRAPLDRVPDRRETESYDGRIWAYTRGYPYLYATVSGGGITPTRLNALLKQHLRAPSDWGHPLLIATPDPEALRATLRRREARRGEDQMPLVELLDLPVPDLVGRG